MAQKSILTDTPERLLMRLSEHLKKKGIVVERVILFGSYAKGTPRAWSDLDVCVVSKEFGRNRYDEMVKLAKLTADIDPMIEAHPYNPRDLADRFDPLAYEIRRYGKVVGN